jgi:2-haloacid dehalogenase
MIKNILFDLDDTLLDFHLSEAEAIIKTLSELGIKPTSFIVKRYSEINMGVWKKLERGEMTREQILVERFRLLFEEIGADADPETTRRNYEKNLGKSVFFVDGAIALLEELYKKFDLYLVSNGTASVQQGRLERSGIEKYFKGIFVSQLIGYNKPDERYFQKVFESIDGFKKEETVIIGDSLSSDIQGGINAGIKTVWFAPKGEQSDLPDITVRSLDEISDLFQNN